MPKISTVLAVFWVLVASTRVQAQGDADSIKHRNEYRFAKQVVETGHPAPHLRWALGYLAGCGSGEQGAAVATRVRALRTETDTSVLRPYWRVSRYLLDRELFEAAEEIALDQFASTEARVFAISALLAAGGGGGGADYPKLVGGFLSDGRVSGGCWTIVADDFRVVGAPLPSNARERAISVRRQLLTGDIEPLDVRTAATCLVPGPPAAVQP